MSDGKAVPARHVFSIGHSNQALETFVDLLQQHGIDVLVDVRSHPSSRYASQFNQHTLASTVTRRGIAYHFLGQELGGRPADTAYYDAEGHVLYAHVAESPAFRNGIAQLTHAIQKHQVAVMCSEEDPAGCHRRLLIGRVLSERGIEVNHIRGDGSIQTESDLNAREATRAATNEQLSLFGPPEERVWRSTRSVLRRNRRPTSSERCDAPGSSASSTCG